MIFLGIDFGESPVIDDRKLIYREGDFSIIAIYKVQSIDIGLQRYVSRDPYRRIDPSLKYDPIIRCSCCLRYEEDVDRMIELFKQVITSEQTEEGRVVEIWNKYIPPSGI